MGKRLVLLSVSLFLLAGCAGVQVTRVRDKNADNGGIRFYRPWPYLLVYQTEHGIEAKTVYLPKMDEEYAIKVKSGFGTVNGKFTLTDGWNLTDFGDTRDSKIPETMTALTGVAAGVDSIVHRGPSDKKVKTLHPGLYCYKFNSEGYVDGLEEVSLFKFIESKPEKPADVKDKKSGK